MKLLAQQDIFGKVSPPVAGIPSDPQVFINKLIGTGIQSFLLIAAIALLIFMLWGALDWITSGGEKEKVSKAQNKITNAVIGMVLVIVMLTVYQVIITQVLGLKNIMNGWQYIIPTLK